MKETPAPRLETPTPHLPGPQKVEPDEVIARLEQERDLYAKALAEVSRRYEEKIEELSLIRRTSDALREALDLESTCRALVESILEEIGGGGCTLMLLNPASGSLEVKATLNSSLQAPNVEPQVAVGWAAGAEEGPIQQAMLERRPILTSDGSIASLYLPLVGREGVIGLFVLSYPSPSALNDNTVRILTIILNQAVIAIEKARFYQNLKEYSENLELKVRERTQELQMLIEHLEEASRHKSRFLANMSHELRTPLNSIIGFAELLKSQTFGPLNEKQLRYVSHIHTSGLDLLALINDILDLSKIEAGRMVLSPTEVILDEAFGAYITMVRPLAEKKGLTIDLNVEPGLSRIQADPGKLRQIMYNLLSNAIKFTPEGGRVVVAVRRPPSGEFVEISVADTGIGIKPEDQERIFLEFEQVEGPYQQKQQGTGLGLALTKRLVELHGGEIWAESEGEGRGSTFTVRLPLVPPGGEGGEQALGDDPGGGG